MENFLKPLGCSCRQMQVQELIRECPRVPRVALRMVLSLGTTKQPKDIESLGKMLLGQHIPGPNPGISRTQAMSWTQAKKQHININSFGGPSRDWVGVETLFVCSSGHSLWARKKHKQNPQDIPGQCRDKLVYVILLRWLVFAANGQTVYVWCLFLSSLDFGSGWVNGALGRTSFQNCSS